MLLLPIISVIAFSGVSIDVSAADIEISKVSVQTAQAFFGDTIPATVDGTPIQFEYYDSFISPVVGLNVDTFSIISTPNDMETYDFVVYRWVASSGFSSHYDTVVFDDFYLRFGDYARGGFALSCRLSDGIQASINNAVTYPDNFCGSFPAVRANASASANLADYYGTMYFAPDSGNLNFRPIYYSFDTGGILDSLQFQSIDNYSNSVNTVMYFIIICPYIGGSMSGQPPFTTTTATTTTNINVNVDVNVDMSETNSILTTISQGIANFFDIIVAALSSVFVPDEDYIKNWLEDVSNLLQESFGSSVDVQGLEDAIKDISTYGATESIRFPGVSFMGFEIEPMAVDLTPIDDLITWTELAFNIFATCCVFNLIQSKIREIIGAKKVVEIE